ncbi:UDP-glycosyltransferase 13-like [Tripterygium wilfordii]|uniref:UDP-glycosyltransferase 13-like n=1 Tax=Tripterygium wilfordii TaxID=458696 RepID=UPI0018F7FAEC|nr:UDP-glycosyltransferase 13-like [Tripterygium wilfordii]
MEGCRGRSITQSLQEISAPPHAMSDSVDLPPYPHVVLIPTAGMGHLTPILRLAVSLVQHNCLVTFITTHPIVSQAESDHLSRFFSAFPQVSQKQFHLLSIDAKTVDASDPFWLQREAFRHSVHLLSSLLSSLHPRPSALVSDRFVASSVIPVAADLDLPNYMLYASSAKMFSLFAYLLSNPDFAQSSEIHIPGIGTIPRSWIPPPLLNPNSLFSQIFMGDGREVVNVKGVLINTFEGLESDTLHALTGGKVLAGLPPLSTVQLLPCEFERRESGAQLEWLNEQETESVVFVNFGSRTALSRDQIRELGKGLVKSGYKFLWVLKDKIVDKEEEESLDEVLGHELMEKIKERGLVVKEWADQGEILSHRAVGGFVSHCGWNSVVESAWTRVRMLAWPQHSDQKINADVVERSGLGLWVKRWGWIGEEVVKGDEIAERIKEMMGSEQLRLQAKRVGEEARKAVGAGGSCENALKLLIREWKNN